MSDNKSKGPVIDPGLCRCCGTMKRCRILNEEYESMGRKEIYSDMIMDCFGLLISYLDGKPSERLICATCVKRLREAISFRKQVLQCEEAFLHMKVYDSKTANRQAIEQVLEDSAPKLEVEIVKMEPVDCELGSPSRDALADDPHSDNDPKPDEEDQGSNDDIPLQRLKRKAPSPQRQLKRKKTVQATSLPIDTRIALKRSTSLRMRMDIENGLKALAAAKPIDVRIQKPKIPMEKVQQMMRERDPSYMTETNVLNIIEYSYVCPFKCRHNHLLCYYCGQNFSDPIKLREHTYSTHHPKRFKVVEHKNMIKVDITRIDCRLCADKIDNLDDFKKHITTVHAKQYYFDHKDSVLPFKLTKEESKCAICDAVFPYFHALNKHMNEHFSNYVCETCGLGFVDRGRFLMHQQRHEEGDYPCQTCGKVFKAHYNRDLHIDRVHKKRGRVYCPKCDVKLMSYPQKLKHLVEVHGEEPLSFPCNMCERVFGTRRLLTLHRRKEHFKDYRYECQCCGQKFFTRFALTNHMPTHTGERNFKCKVCEKSYPRLKTLKDHLRIHTNDRRCGSCWADHRIIMTADKCPHCRAQAYPRSTRGPNADCRTSHTPLEFFLRHMQVPSRCFPSPKSQRYRCHICGQAFIQNCSLKGHLKSQHPEYG